jgi:hypothetical protein
MKKVPLLIRKHYEKSIIYFVEKKKVPFASLGPSSMKF